MLKHPRVSFLNWVGIGIGIFCLSFAMKEGEELAFESPEHFDVEPVVFILTVISTSVALICGILSETPLLMLPQLIVLALHIARILPSLFSIEYELLYTRILIAVILDAVFMVTIFVLYILTTIELRRKRSTANKAVLQYVPTTDTQVIRGEELQKMNVERAS